MDWKASEERFAGEVWRWAWLLVGLALLLAACKGQGELNTPQTAATAMQTTQPGASSTPLESSTPRADPALTQADADPDPSPTATVPRPTATSGVLEPQNPQYIITATLDYPLRRLTVQQEIVYPHPSEEIISDIILVVEANRFPGAFSVTELRYGDGREVFGYRFNGNRMRVPLDEPFLAGQALRLRLDYQLNLPKITPSEMVGPNPFGYTARQINVVDWYPFIPPRTPEGDWIVHDPWFYGEHLVYPLADFDVRVRARNAPESLSIAASALPQMEGEWRRYQLKGARNFALSMSPDYVVLEETVGEVTVLGYAFPTDVIAGEAAFRTTVQALKLYSELFAPYPHESLSLVEADFLHGMEYQGLHYLSRGFYNLYTGTPRDYLTAIAAHETAHQWWYGLVASDQALEPWLDEALCTYSERLFYEHVHPEDLDWWWEARVDFYRPEGKVDSDLYETGGYRPYVNAVYLRGALFLEDLRALMGEGDLLSFLKDYAQKNVGDIVTEDEFFDLLEAHTEADLSGVLGEYFK